MSKSTKELTRFNTPGIVLCMPYCENLYLWNTVLQQGEPAHVLFHYRCIKCGANHLGVLDEYFLGKSCRETTRMGNNENPPSCTL